MKVSINFDDVRCVVPVGDGSLPVKQVILLAIERYKKATSKSSEIIVHKLKTCRDGAILDPDDRLLDVADDREQLIAVFEEIQSSNNQNINMNQRQENQSFFGKYNYNKERLQQQQQPVDNMMNISVNHHQSLSSNIGNHQQQQQHMSSSISLENGFNINSYSHHQQQHHHHHQKSNSLHSSFDHHQKHRLENIYRQVVKLNQKPNLTSIIIAKQQQQAHHHESVMNPFSIKNQQNNNISLYGQHQNNGHFYSCSISDSLISSPFQHGQHHHPSSEVIRTYHNYMSNNVSHLTNVVPQSKSDSQVNTANQTKIANSQNQNNNKNDQTQSSTMPSLRNNSSSPSNAIISTNNKEKKLNHSRFDDETIITEDDDDCDEAIEITADQINSYSNIPLLHVRHGSEPNLNSFSSDEMNPYLMIKHTGTANNKHVNKNLTIDDHSISDTERHSHHHLKSNDLAFHQTSKRWSTAIAIDQSVPSRLINSTKKSSLISNYEHSDEDKSFNSVSPQSTKEEGYGSEEQSNSQSESGGPNPPTSPSSMNSPQLFVNQSFARGSGRLSMLANNLDQWADAADRQLIKLKNKETSNSIKNHTQNFQKHQQLCDSSLGSMSNSSQENENNSRNVFYVKGNEDNKLNCLTVIINLTKESGPLGIHVLPDEYGRGLRIEGIEPGGRIDRDGRLNVGDAIIEVNDHSFIGMEFEKAQEIFRSLLQNDQIKLSIIKSTYCDNNDNERNEQLENEDVTSDSYKDKHLLVEGEERSGQMTKTANVTSTKKHSSPAVNLIGYKPATSAIVIANTRRIGKKYHIQLKKSEHGLGFTITTRDNPAGGLSPIYIKTILPRGAAVQDGRLKPGDRLLEVCGIEMTGKSQDEAVKILRNLPSDSIVDLIVSRQEVEVSPSPLMPRQLPPEAAKETNCSSAKECEVMTFQIPLNDTGSAGLGISVKGKTLTADGKQQDSGIFIKSVLHGGAASKDGRLKQDDQLININGIPLSGKTNSEAMETLTRATIKSAHQITLTIARRICHSPSHYSGGSNDGNSTFRHQHEMSVLSNESYDMPFNQSNDAANNSRLYNDSYSQEDSFRSSQENTVIYNSSNKPNFSSDESKNSLGNTSQTQRIQNQSSLNDSQLSLNESAEQAAERFRRDGFGRQSMSEKRHAQLDAKTTDTYRRSKKNKDQKNKENNEPNQINNVQDGDGDDVHGHDHHKQIDDVHDNVRQKDIVDHQRTSSVGISSKKVKSPTKNQIIFSPVCCWKCQSPGSCPCRSKSDMSNDLYNARMNGYPMDIKMPNHHPMMNHTNATSPFGLRKSCSLESLQTMMQDLQKEQLEHVGGNVVVAGGGPYNTPRHATTLRAGKSQPNESFRVAVDRSYEIKNYLNHANMQSVTEEGDDETISRPSTCPYRVGGGHSMTSTNFTGETSVTATTTNADDANLLKPLNKKKKNLFKNLFHFGSKKGRSKSMEPGAKKDEPQEIKMYSPDYSRKYRLEQERINEHYRKLVEQEQRQQQQHYPFVRNQLHPMHQSMPLSSSHRSRAGISPRTATLQQNASSQIYVSNSSSPRDTVGVPQVNTTNNKNDNSNKIQNVANFPLRSQHRIHPEQTVFNDNGQRIQDTNNYVLQTNENPRHIRINSQEFYGRTSMERTNSGVPENVTYGNYPLFANKMINTTPRHYGTTSRCATMDSDKNIHHYRQLSLRNIQHQRQVSSPASTQSFYHHHQQQQSSNSSRPISNYMDYEQQTQPSQQQNEFPHQRSYTVNISNTRSFLANPPTNQIKNDPNSVYGIIAQHHHHQHHPPTQPQQQQQQLRIHPQQGNINGPNLIRQQPQPIYQTNKVQIYSTVYNPNIAAQSANQNTLYVKSPQNYS